MHSPSPPHLRQTSRASRLRSEPDNRSSQTLPIFLAFLSVTATDKTGDGTDYTIVCDTEVFDQASNYDNATGIFTAPITGIYRFTAQISLQGLLATHNQRGYQIVTNNRTYYGYNSYVSITQDFCNFSCLAKMTAGHTATLHSIVANSTKVVDIQGNVSLPYTMFSGEFVC